MRRIYVILLSAGVLGVGILLNIVACAIPWDPNKQGASWFNMFTILFYVLSPIPVAVCGKRSNDPFSEGSNMGDLAFFITGIMVASGFALPSVLMANGVIVWQTLLMSLIGSVVTLTAVVVIIKFVLSGSDSTEMSSW